MRNEWRPGNEGVNLGKIQGEETETIDGVHDIKSAANVKERREARPQRRRQEARQSQAEDEKPAGGGDGKEGVRRG